MVFTVGLPGGTRDYEYEAYIRLLEKEGVDVANTQRVADPATGKRWLYAWDAREAAERFAVRLKEDTGIPDWNVYELPGVEPATGPLGPIVILVGRQSDGYSYSLTPSSKKLIKRLFPQANIAPNLFISTTTQSDFESTHGAIWDQVAIILTGLSEQQARQLGGFQVYDPAKKQILRESVPLKT
jgi:hypothetical protein